MGLDVSHDAWQGAYSSFMRWRKKIAEVAGLPPLELMRGFFVPFSDEPLRLPTLYHGIDTGKPRPLTEPHLAELNSQLPINWECLNPSPLHELLYHSDCDGEIPANRCGPIADELEKLIPNLPDGEDWGHIGNWRDKTAQFIKGLREAAEANEPLEFY